MLRVRRAVKAYEMRRAVANYSCDSPLFLIRCNTINDRLAYDNGTPLAPLVLRGDVMRQHDRGEFKAYKGSTPSVKNAAKRHFCQLPQNEGAEVACGGDAHINDHLIEYESTKKRKAEAFLLIVLWDLIT